MVWCVFTSILQTILQLWTILIFGTLFYRSRTPTSSRSPSSASMGRPASAGAGPRPPVSGSPEESASKRIKMEENARKSASGHVSLKRIVGNPAYWILRSFCLFVQRMKSNCLISFRMFAVFGVWGKEENFFFHLESTHSMCVYLVFFFLLLSAYLLKDLALSRANSWFFLIVNIAQECLA